MPPRNPSLPANQERHALQMMLSGNWKAAPALFPTTERTLSKMVDKGWIERRVSKHFEYRITDAGREAFRARLPETASPRTR
jgi:DNA-binding PadR family transcriptional regulator